MLPWDGGLCNPHNQERRNQQLLAYPQLLEGTLQGLLQMSPPSYSVAALSPTISGLSQFEELPVNFHEYEYTQNKSANSLYYFFLIWENWKKKNHNFIGIFFSLKRRKKKNEKKNYRWNIKKNTNLGFYGRCLGLRISSSG